MGVMNYLRGMYCLDTLDTRFTNSPKVPYKVVIDARNGHGTVPVQDAPVNLDSKRKQILPKPALWKTPEFYFYYVVFLTVVPYMFWVVYDVSRSELIQSTPLLPLLTSHSIASSVLQVRELAKSRMDSRTKDRHLR